jgi:hypothetical protein
MYSIGMLHLEGVGAASGRTNIFFSRVAIDDSAERMFVPFIILRNSLEVL